MEVTQIEDTVFPGTELETLILLMRIFPNHRNQNRVQFDVMAHSQTQTVALMWTSVMKDKVIVTRMKIAQMVCGKQSFSHSLHQKSFRFVSDLGFALSYSFSKSNPHEISPGVFIFRARLHRKELREMVKQHPKRTTTNKDAIFGTVWGMSEAWLKYEGSGRVAVVGSFSATATMATKFSLCAYLLFSRKIRCFCTYLPIWKSNSVKNAIHTM